MEYIYSKKSPAEEITASGKQPDYKVVKWMGSMLLLLFFSVLGYCGEAIAMTQSHVKSKRCLIESVEINKGFSYLTLHSRIFLPSQSIEQLNTYLI
jgi:hypothetical protein